MGKAYTVKEGHLLRIDPFTSKILTREKFFVPSNYNTTSNYTGTNSCYTHNADRGSSHSTTTTTTGDTTKSELDRGTNIVDVSNAGAKERRAKENVLEMMKLTPMIRELSYPEVRELGMASGWWARG
jgi:hypothetical protein